MRAGGWGANARACARVGSWAGAAASCGFYRPLRLTVLARLEGLTPLAHTLLPLVLANRCTATLAALVLLAPVLTDRRAATRLALGLGWAAGNGW